MKRRSFLQALGLCVIPINGANAAIEIPCPKCGYGNSVVANFCADCGAAMRRPPPSGPAVPGGDQPLVIEPGKLVHTRFCMGPTVVGGEAIVESFGITPRSETIAYYKAGDQAATRIHGLSYWDAELHLRGTGRIGAE